MSLVLGIDCCTKRTSVGCCSEGVVLGDISLDLGRRQSVLLPFLVEQLLQNIEATLSDVDLISVTAGPGYFTGVRVGISYASALAEGLGVRVVPVSTLKALAAAFPIPDFLIVPLLWARQGYFFAAAYLFGAHSLTFLEPSFLSEEQVRRFLIEQRYKTMILGPDVERFDLSLVPDVFPLPMATVQGSTVALLGEASGREALEPKAVCAEYLRSADIG